MTKKEWAAKNWRNAQWAKYIEHFDDEREIGNGIIITLKKGYVFYDDCGVIGVDKESEIPTQMKRIKEVVPA